MFLGQKHTGGLKKEYSNMASQKKNEKKQPPSESLHIKIISPRQGSEKKIQAARGKNPQPFREVNSNFRYSLSKRIQTIDNAIDTSIKNIGAAPVRVKLIEKALAKSHRPENLFSIKTCPIIGVGKTGELFIKATHEGLRSIDKTIVESKKEQIIKEISTIETIEPITPADRLNGVSSKDVLVRSPRVKKGFLTKVQLFDFGYEEDQLKLVYDFQKKCREKKIKIERRGYSKTSNYYEATCKTVDEVEYLSKITGVRSIKKMPILKTIRSHSLACEPLPKDLPIPVEKVSAYPIVAVVDTGVTDAIPSLNKWVIGRESTVAPQYRNSWHGTFVAGLLTWSKELNPKLKSIDLTPCSIFDFQVVPNGDVSMGDTDTLSEAQLLQDLEMVLNKHANKIKVWNLSLGSNQVCSLDEFSSFAVELDTLQDKYKVSFVISAGNYETPPLLDYPRKAVEMELGRITAPADSVLGVTVGSIAHCSHAGNGPKKNELSAFSRHGAGPNYIIKPDLVHFGGTCCVECIEKFGIRSIDGGKIGESMGTSFSTPLVSRLLANIYHRITPTPTPVLARALLTHHARDPREGGRVPDTEENFFGFGLPSSLKETLECKPWTSTLIFQDYLRPGYYLEWDDFPYPNCLKKNGRCYGNVWMTIAFNPAKNPKWGTEYCETHIDAHFGVYTNVKNRTTGVVKEKFKGLVPPEHKNVGLLHEKFQVAHMRKWAPVRTYFGCMGPTGQKASRWRLRLQLLARHASNRKDPIKAQPFAIIITIADPDKQAPVYNDMAIQLRSRFESQNVALRATTRVQSRT